MWPAKTTPFITQPFGANPADYAQYGFPGHEGIDVRAPQGTPILAVADGTVVNRADSGDEGYGRAIRVMHADGWTTTYAHLSSYGVYSAGANVRAGDILGYAGSTGNSTGAHLHLTLTLPGTPYIDSAGRVWPKFIHDPTPYLKPLMNPPVGRDLLPYLKGDGRIYQMTVIWKGQEHSQQMQTQPGSGRFYLVKNHEWEELFADETTIYRGIDTSPGEGLYYRQRDNLTAIMARWCPRRWSVGGVYERNPIVTFHRKDNGATVSTSRPVTWLKYAAHHANWRSAHGGLTFPDVAELHWLLRPDSAAPAETYFYAAGFGLVGWSSSSGDHSYVVEAFAPGERQPMEREKIVVV